MGAILDKLKQLFSGPQIEVALVGLENSGKTTLLNRLSIGEPLPTIPTIGLNVKSVKKGGVNMKVWDLGGQMQYRAEWGRYTKGCDAIIFMLDASNQDTLPISKRELYALLEDKEHYGIPLLVIGNKVDLKPHLTQQEIIDGLTLDYITSTNSWVVCMASALHGSNIAEIVDWLIKTSRDKKKDRK